MIQVDDNPFVGTVISAKTDEGVIFFGQEDLFKPFMQDKSIGNLPGK